VCEREEEKDNEREREFERKIVMMLSACVLKRGKIWREG